MKRLLAAPLLIALTLAGSPVAAEDQGTPAQPHNPPIVWSIGEWQMTHRTTHFDFRGGDRVNVYMATRNTSKNAKKCANWSGDGLLLRKWRGRLWEVCINVDYAGSGL